MGASKRICPNCGRKMKQQFIGPFHCKCGTSWKRDIVSLSEPQIITEATGSAGGFGVYALKGRIAGASNVFVYTKTLFALQNACWGSAPSPFDLHFPMQAAHPGGTLFTR